MNCGRLFPARFLWNSFTIWPIHRHIMRQPGGKSGRIWVRAWPGLWPVRAAGSPQKRHALHQGEKPCVQGVLADPVGLHDGWRQTVGIMISRVSATISLRDTMDMGLVDRVIKVADREAFGNARLLAFAGRHNLQGPPPVRRWRLYASWRTAAREEPLSPFFPDRGEDRYFSKGLYD